VPQDQINERLIALARAGKSVVRLKGGDPFVFGRGGEEIEALVAAGVASKWCPASRRRWAVRRAPASRSLIVTIAQACVFVTGHLKNGTVDLDWTVLARPRQTVVIYMGSETLSSIARELVHHGLSASTPSR
jgi:uroporphyrin-III C-methyltransferase/precorrin-2 dehydrogenase/sirohydrochlorin ferrochelatase